MPHQKKSFLDGHKNTFTIVYSSVKAKLCVSEKTEAQLHWKSPLSLVKNYPSWLDLLFPSSCWTTLPTFFHSLRCILLTPSCKSQTPEDPQGITEQIAHSNWSSLSHLLPYSLLPNSGFRENGANPLPSSPTMAQNALAFLFFSLTGRPLPSCQACSVLPPQYPPAFPVIIWMDMAWLTSLISLEGLIILLHIFCFCLFQRIIEFAYTFFFFLKFNRPFNWDNSR